MSIPTSKSCIRSIPERKVLSKHSQNVDFGGFQREVVGHFALQKLRGSLNLGRPAELQY